MRALTAGFVVSATLHLLLVAVGWWLWRAPSPDVATPRPLPLTLAMFANETPTPVVAAPSPAHEPPPTPTRKPQPAPRREPVVEPQPAAPLSPPEEAVPASNSAAVVPEAVAPPRVDDTLVAKMEEEYRSALRNLIEAGKVYPLKARRLHHQGVVLLSFTIDPDGTIRDIEMRTSSGSAILDEAALALIHGISGRLPAPAGLAQRARSFTIPLAYRIK